MRDRTEVLEAGRGIDVVVHAAALHGIYLDKYTTDDFWDLNVAGPRNVYEAALECGVGKVLLCSTMGVYGENVLGIEDPPGALGLVPHVTRSHRAYGLFVFA